MFVDIFVCVSRLSRQYLKFFTGNKQQTQSSQRSASKHFFLSCLLHKSIHFCPVVAIPVYISGRKEPKGSYNKVSVFCAPPTCESVLIICVAPRQRNCCLHKQDWFFQMVLCLPSFDWWYFNCSKIKS